MQEANTHLQRKTLTGVSLTQILHLWNLTYSLVLSCQFRFVLFFTFYFYLFIFLYFILFFNFTILYWFCHISK